MKTKLSTGSYKVLQAAGGISFASLEVRALDYLQERIKPGPSEDVKTLEKLHQVVKKQLKWQMIPFVFTEIDMQAVVEFRKKHKNFTGFFPFIFRAAFTALKELSEKPSLAFCLEGKKSIQIVSGGQSVSLRELNKKLQAISDKVRAGKVPENIQEKGTLAISSAGAVNSPCFCPNLDAGEIGVLGVHDIVKRLVTFEDDFSLRPILNLSISYDYRVVDGKQLNSFLQRVREMLESSSWLSESL